MKPASSAQSICGRVGLACFFVMTVLSVPEIAAAAVNAQPPVVTTSFVSVVQVMLGLGLVLAAIAGTAWLLRRLAPGQVAASGSLRVVGGVAVGPKERVILVDVGDTRLVLGVAPGQISTLHQMPRPLEDSGQAPEQGGEIFSARLMKILSRKGGNGAP